MAALRVLAVAVGTGTVSYVFFVGERLKDWGLSDKAARSTKQAQAYVQKLIAFLEPDVVVTVLDAANLERNLYLAVQVLEMEAPVVVALNMADVAEEQNIHIERSKLRETLQVPVIRTVASREEGTSQLLDAVVETARQSTS